MKRSQRLYSLIKLAHHEQKKRAILLAKANDLLTHQCTQLDQLHEYKKDYIVTLQQRGQQGLAMNQWRQMQGFLQQIDSMIQLQHEHIAQAKRKVSEQKDFWMQAYQREQALIKAQENIQTDEWREENKEEQKQLDELVTQKYLRDRAEKN